MRASVGFSGLALLAVVSLVNPRGLLAGEGEKNGEKGHGDRPSKEAVFKHIDTNGDGKISAEEFMNHKPPHEPPPGAPSKEEVFKKLDADGDGFISQDEFKLPPPPPGKKGGKDGKDGPHKHGGEAGGTKK